jgi:hypothetical protein
MRTWNVQSNENVIPDATGIVMKNIEDIMMPKEHRRIKKEMPVSYSNEIQKEDSVTAVEDSGKPISNSDLDANEFRGVATKSTKNSYNAVKVRNGNVMTQVVKSGDAGVHPDQGAMGGQLQAGSNMFEARPVRSADAVTERVVSSGNKETAAGHPAAHSVVAASGNRNSDDYSSENNLMPEVGKSSVIREMGDNPETGSEIQSSMSQKMFDMHRGYEEGFAVSHNPSSENKALSRREVATQDTGAGPYNSDSFTNKEQSSMTESDEDASEKISSSSDTDKRQITQDTGLGNYVVIKDEDPTSIPMHKTEYSRSKFDQNDSQDNYDDGSSKPETSSQTDQEHQPQTSFDNSNNGMMARYFIESEAPLYYVNSPSGSAYLKSRSNELSHMCVVPCSPMNYNAQPYAYGGIAHDPYGAGYATDAQLPPAQFPLAHLPPAQLPPAHLPPVQLPPAQLPPVHLPPAQFHPAQFPQMHGGSSAFSGVSIGGHGSSNHEAHGHDYAVTTNAYGGSSHGAHMYGGASHSYVKEPVNHLEYSLATPQKYLHTSLILKAPQQPAAALYDVGAPHMLPVPFRYMHPHIHHAEQKDINLHKLTYF